MNNFEYKKNKAGTEIIITKYIGLEPDVRIPSVIDNLPVTTIQYERGGSECKLKKVFIPDSITAFSRYSFPFNNTTNIQVDPNNPRFSSIDGVLFNKDQTILIRYPDEKPETEYIIPDTVTVIGAGAFIFCYNLVSVIIPEGVVTIDNGAFGNCTGLTKVVLPSTVTTINTGAFAACNNLSSVIVTGNNLSFIGPIAFESFNRLYDIELPECTIVDPTAFDRCNITRRKAKNE